MGIKTKKPFSEKENWYLIITDIIILFQFKFLHKYLSFYWDLFLVLSNFLSTWITRQTIFFIAEKISVLCFLFMLVQSLWLICKQFSVLIFHAFQQDSPAYVIDKSYTNEAGFMPFLKKTLVLLLNVLRTLAVISFKIKWLHRHWSDLFG